MRRKGMITGMSHACDMDSSVSFPFENLIRNLSCFSCGGGTKTFTRESNWSQYVILNQNNSSIHCILSNVKIGWGRTDHRNQYAKIYESNYFT